MSDFIKLIARILMSALFIVSGYTKLTDVSGILNNPGTKKFMELVSPGTATPEWLGYLIGGIEVVGGVAILLGFMTRFAASGLFIWTAIATYFGHWGFWLMEGPARIGNQLNFEKNMVIMGAFLLLALAGAGRYSVDGGDD
jgi:putative oxidoreductase